MHSIHLRQEAEQKHNKPHIPFTPGLAWEWFSQLILAYAGVLFFLAGVICFFAYNWHSLLPFVKFSLIAAALLISAVFSLFRDSRPASGKLWLLACCILGGILMAVYGQVYQTGANAWILFRSWAIFLIPLVLISRQTALWFMLWLVSSLSGILYLGEYAAAFHNNALTNNLIFYQCLAQTAFFVLWETASHFFSGQRCAFLKPRWMPRILGFSLLSFLTFYLALHIQTIRQPPFIYFALLYLALITGILFYYRQQRTDLFMTAATFFSLIVLALVWITYALADEIILFFCLTACLIAGSALSGKYLVVHHRQWHTLKHPCEKTEKVPSTKPEQPEKPEFFTIFSLHELRFTLKNRLINSFPAKNIPDKNRDRKNNLPWQARLLIGSCAWIAVPCLTGFTILLFPNIEKQEYLLIFLLLLGAGIALTYCSGIFLNQTALCLCLTGACTASLLAGMETGNKEWAILPAVVILAASAFPAKNHTYRFLAATLAIALFLLQVNIFFNTVGRYVPCTETIPSHLACWAITAICPLFYVACGIKLASFWRHTVISKKWKWRQQPLIAALFAAPLLIGLLFMLFSTFTPAAFSKGIGLSGTSIHLAGIGAIAGLGYLILQVPQIPKKNLPVQFAIILPCLLLAVISWYLPWLGIGLLLLALAYQAESPALSIVALLFMAGCTVLEYYTLSTTLLLKSFSLCGIGLLLLAGATGLHWYKTLIHKEQPLSTARLPKNSPKNHIASQNITLPPLSRFSQALPILWIGIFLAFFSFSVHQKETLLANGQHVILAMRPLDPRSLMQGDYMTLSFDIENAINRKRYAQPEENPSLHHTEGTVIAAPDKNGVFHFVRFDNGNPLQKQEIRLIYRLKKKGAQIGPGSFFFQEGQGKVFENARFAELRVNEAGETLLACLLDENRNCIHPES
ncbi:MAG: GDYXXLXY domain-containing protein [Alistipes senegalensis]|nr:GDYXXLXY domain-containing protein [Oxalobacter formigenes]MCM1281109.1 GDYXXLXY domain-containing protein [Alistipes senegalensis]